MGGSEAAFAELVRRETPRVEAVAWGLSGDPTVAAEIAQDAMVRLHRALPSLRGAARLSTWLYRTVINLHHDRRRTQLRERRLIPMAEMGPMSSSSPGPDEQAEAGERARAVEAAVGALPAPMREAIVLRYFRGLDYAEIAEVLQCPSGTVASRMHRALRLVGALLAQHGIREGSL